MDWNSQKTPNWSKRSSDLLRKRAPAQLPSFSDICGSTDDSDQNATGGASPHVSRHGRLLGSVQSKLTRGLGKLDWRKPFDEARLRMRLLKQEEAPHVPEEMAGPVSRYKAMSSKEDTRASRKYSKQRTFTSALGADVMEQEDRFDNSRAAPTRRIKVDDWPDSQQTNDKLSRLCSPISFSLVHETDNFENVGDAYIHLLESIPIPKGSETPQENFDAPKVSQRIGSMQNSKESKDAAGKSHLSSKESKDASGISSSRRSSQIGNQTHEQQSQGPGKKKASLLRKATMLVNLKSHQTDGESGSRRRSDTTQMFESEPSKKSVETTEESKPSWKTVIGQAKEEMGEEKTLRTVQDAYGQLDFQQRMITALKSYPPSGNNRSDSPSEEDDESPTEKGSEASTLKAFALLQQDHIKAGQPFNFGKWLATSGSSSSAFESMQSQSLLVAGYLCGDFAVQSLCKNFPEGIGKLEELDLGTNSLSDSAVRTLASALGQPLRFLSLANNSLGSSACDALCSFLNPNSSLTKRTQSRTEARKLHTLNLSRNPLRDSAVSKLCNCLSNVLVPDLTNLGLAETQIGRDPSVGDAFRKLIADHRNLTVLDLHYNYLYGHAAYEILYGLYENDEAGRLQRLDFSWNQLAIQSSWRIATMLGTILRDCNTLVHLDLSYNKLCAKDMELIAQGLHQNSTLLGLHLVGNAAACDADGFVIPLPNWIPDRAEGAEFSPEGDADALPTPKSTLKESSKTPSNKRQTVTKRQSSMTPDAKKKQSNATDQEERSSSCPVPSETPDSEEGHFFPDDEDTPLPSSGSLLKVPLGQPLSPQQNVEWLNKICVNIPPKFHGQNCSEWVSAESSSRPSYNKSSSMQWIDMKAQRAKTTRRVRPFESTSRAPVFGCCWICESWIEVEICWHPGLSGPELAEDVKGAWAFLSIDNFAHPVTMQPRSKKDSTWVGYRVLPPSNSQFLVIFQINDKLCVAQNFKSKTLQSPISVTLAQDSESENGSSDSATVQISKANIMPIAEWATGGGGAESDRKHAAGRLLTITEDPNDQKKMIIMPRHCKKEAKDLVEQPRWTFAQSVWAPWHWESEELMDRCFKLDWSLAGKKLEKWSMVPLPEIAKMQKSIRTYYDLFYDLFLYYSFVNLDPKSAPCIRLGDFTQIAGQVFKLQACSSDCIFINVQHVPPAMQASVPKKNKAGLQRYQFLESIVRIAQIDGCEGTSWAGIGVGVIPAFEALTVLAKSVKQHLLDRRNELFTERCDNTFKGHLAGLRMVFEFYRPRHHTSMPHLHRMCQQGWMDFLKDANAFDEEFRPREASLVFGYSILPVINVYAYDAVFEMGFREFLVGIGMAVREMKTYITGMLPDCLDEFLSDNVELLHCKILEWQGNPLSNNMRGYDLAPDWLGKLSSYLRVAFKLSDDDVSRSLSKREFVTAYESPYFKEKLIELELEISSYSVFQELDADDDGELTYVEALRGLCNLKQRHKNQTRAMSVVRGIFAIADVDKGGSVSKAEFLKAFGQDDIQQLIRRNGLSFLATDLEDVFEEMDIDKSGTLSLEEIMDGFSKMKHGDGESADYSGDRNMGFLRTLFAEADIDHSGSLSRSELARMLKQPRVCERLQRMGLMSSGSSESMLSYYFEECDENGDNAIDLQEFENGYLHIREVLRHRLIDQERLVFEAQMEDGDATVSQKPQKTRKSQAGR